MTSIELSQAKAISEGGLAIAVSRDGESRLLVVRGELDMATVPHLGAALDAESERDAPIVVDLASLDFIDMTGLRALLDAAAQAATKAQAFEILNPSPAVERLLELTGFGSRFSIRRA
jgi:anti-sigma B factor antagonist